LLLVGWGVDDGLGAGAGELGAGGGGDVLGGGTGVGDGWLPAPQKTAPPAEGALFETVQPPLARMLQNSVGTMLPVRSELAYGTPCVTEMPLVNVLLRM
jgi:hypothetical protein